MRAVLFALMMLILSACSTSAVIETQLTPQERTLIRGAIEDISRGDGPALAKKVPPELTAKIAPALPQMQRALPSGPLEISLDNMDWRSINGTRSAHAVYQVHGQSGWALVEATTQSGGRTTTLTGIFVQKTATSPRELNGFSLARAGPSQWAIMATIVAAVAVTVAGLIRIWRSGLFGRRWLWTIGALIGVTTLKLNWSTGATLFQPISFQLFSVSVSKQPIYAPWILSVSLPLVALIALFRRRRPKSTSEGADGGNVTLTE
jgi:hypothetical protein